MRDLTSFTGIEPASGGILGNHMLGQVCIVHCKVLDQNVVGALQLGALQASAQQL